MSGSKKALELIGVYQPPTAPAPTATVEDDRQVGGLESVPQVLTNKPLVRARTHFKYDKGTPRGLFNWILGRSKLTDSLTRSGATVDQDAALSEDPEKAQANRKRDRKGKHVSRPKPQSGIAKAIMRLVENTSRQAKGSQGSEEPVVFLKREGTEKIIMQPLERCVFDGMFPRGPILDYDKLFSTKNAEVIAEYLNTSKSTARTLADWLRNEEWPGHAGSRLSSPLDSLFAIAQRDTLNILRLIDGVLKDIGQQVLDDTLIQQRLIHWRQLFENFEAELQRLEASLRQFAKFAETVVGLQSSGENTSKRSTATEIQLQECVDQISEIRRRTNRSYKSLISNLAVVESKRGISEAESVTKLTELAFFFIPLTFSASLFSMQIKEITTTNVSIAAFLTVAIVITVCSYGIRLFIRSESVIEFRRHCASEIRADADIPPGGFIPTSTFLVWIWHRLGLLTVTVSLLIVILAIPLVFIWTRDMNHGYKAIITIIDLILVLGTSYLVGKATLHVDQRGRLHFRRDMFAKQSRRPGQERQRAQARSILFSLSSYTWLSSRWFLSGIVATVIAVGPLVAVWTRPIVTGIKIGVTSVIGIIYICSIVIIALIALRRLEI